MQDLATKEELLEVWVNEGLYELLLNIGNSRVVNSCEQLPHFLWHCWLGHLNSKYMSLLVHKGLVKSFSKSFDLCNSCFIGKSHASSHPSWKTLYKPLTVIFSGIWRPDHVISTKGYSYYVNFVDVESKFNWVFPLVHKSDLYHAFEKFRLWAEWRTMQH